MFLTYLITVLKVKFNWFVKILEFIDLRLKNSEIELRILISDKLIDTRAQNFINKFYFNWQIEKTCVLQISVD